jgi:hypothetical protein
MLEDMSNPISVLGAKRAADLSGTPFPHGKSIFDRRDRQREGAQALDAMGAPGVIERSPASARRRPMPKRPLSRIGSPTSMASSSRRNLKPQERRETAEEIRGLRTAILNARSNGDQDKLQELLPARSRARDCR